MREKDKELTRRSAGLPAAITGILSAYPSGAFFEEIIINLQTIACEPVIYAKQPNELRLHQVHALNSLKDVFTNAQLGPSTEIHLTKTLVIAVDCLDSDM